MRAPQRRRDQEPFTDPRLMTIRARITEGNPVLLDIWHRAVKVTHAFLGEQDIAGFIGTNDA